MFFVFSLARSLVPFFSRHGYNTDKADSGYVNGPRIRITGPRERARGRDRAHEGEGSCVGVFVAASIFFSWHIFCCFLFPLSLYVLSLPLPVSVCMVCVFVQQNKIQLHFFCNFFFCLPKNKKKKTSVARKKDNKKTDVKLKKRKHARC